VFLDTVVHKPSGLV